MTCHILAPGVVVCHSAGDMGRAILRCPGCKRRRRTLLTDHGWAYGETCTCCTCGALWGSAAPAWDTRSRKRLAARAETARALWRDPGTLSPRTYRAAVWRRMEP